MASISAPLPRLRAPAFGLRALSDDRLFALAAAGDERAFEAIYHRHSEALYRYCRSIVADPQDAADALQSTMAAALRGIAGERRQIALRPWLFRIAHNESVSLLRTRHSHSAIDDAAGLAAPAQDLSVGQRFGELMADLRSLPERQRGALVMHELSGLSHGEIAEALGTSEGHARQLVYEARTALHEMAEGRDVGCESIRLAISDADGRVLRGRRVRAHLRACSGCSDFAGAMTTRRSSLAAIAPPMPAGLAAALLRGVLGGGSGGASGGAVIGSLAVKAGALMAIGAVAGVGSAEIEHHALPAAKPAPSVVPSSASVAAPAAAPNVSLPAAAPAPRIVHRHAGVRAYIHAPAATPVHHPPPGHVVARTPAHATDPVNDPVKSRAPAPAASDPAQPAQPTGATSAPGQVKKTTGNAPPGQEKETNSTVPPGQQKKLDGTNIPPGQAKKLDGTNIPPGQQKKITTEAPASTTAPTVDPTGNGRGNNGNGNGNGEKG